MRVFVLACVALCGRVGCAVVLSALGLGLFASEGRTGSESWRVSHSLVARRSSIVVLGLARLVSYAMVRGRTRRGRPHVFRLVEQGS